MSIAWEPESLDKTSAQAEHLTQVLDRLDQTLLRVRADAQGIDPSAALGKSAEALQKFDALIDHTLDSATRLSATLDRVASKSQAQTGENLTPANGPAEAAGDHKKGEHQGIFQEILTTLGGWVSPAKDVFEPHGGASEAAESAGNGRSFGLDVSDAVKRSTAAVREFDASIDQALDLATRLSDVFDGIASKATALSGANLTPPGEPVEATSGRKGGGEYQEIFEPLGEGLKSVSGGLKSTGDILENLGKGVGGVAELAGEEALAVGAEVAGAIASAGLEFVAGLYAVAAAFVKIEETAFKVAGALGDVISRTEEEHQQQLQTLRVLGATDPEAERGNVNKKADELGYTHDELFDVLKSESGFKIRAGENPEEVSRARRDMAAGALTLSGGSVTGAKYLTAQLGEASQTGNFEGLRAFGFERVLEEQEHLTPQQAEAVLSPGSDPKAIQRSLQIVEQALIDLSHVKAPETLPRELQLTQNALDGLISGYGFPLLTASLHKLSTMLSSKDLVPFLMMADVALSFTVGLLNYAVEKLSKLGEAINYVLHPIDEFLKSHPTLAHIAGVDSGTTENSGAPPTDPHTSPPAGPPVPLRQERVQILLPHHNSNRQLDLNHPSGRSGPAGPPPHRPRATLRIGHIEVHTHVNGQANPEEIARHAARLVPIELSAFMEHSQYLKEGTS